MFLGAGRAGKMPILVTVIRAEGPPTLNGLTSLTCSMRERSEVRLREEPLSQKHGVEGAGSPSVLAERVRAQRLKLSPKSRSVSDSAGGSVDDFIALLPF